jgi:hypothetical protein
MYTEVRYGKTFLSVPSVHKDYVAAKSEAGQEGHREKAGSRGKTCPSLLFQWWMNVSESMNLGTQLISSSSEENR